MTWTPVLWLLLFVPALIALYFLKLKRMDVVVSSTFLWKKSVEDFRVNAPFQRLRRSWLLILQLLALAGLILAVWRPRTSVETTGGRDLVLLLDNSASMTAREAGGTRLELARQQALDAISGMKAGDRMTLLAFSSKTVPLGPATGDAALLESRVRGIEATALPTDLEQALRVAASVAESLVSPEIRVIGDGCYGDLTDLPPELKRLGLRFASTGTQLDNVGISEVDVRRSFEVQRRTVLFALLENSGKAEATRVVSLSIGGELQDAREVRVPPGGSAPVVFELAAGQEGIARVSLDAEDGLALDDEAQVRIPPSRTTTVLVAGKPNPWIDLVLEATAEVRYRRVTMDELKGILDGASAAGEAPEADVLIFDREAPPFEPPLPSICIGCLPPLPEGVKPPGRAAVPVVVDWDRSHPVHRFLTFTELFIEESYVFEAVEGYRSLVESDQGSIVGVLRYQPAGRAPARVILIGFDILASNWPIGHYSYPIFFSNALTWLGSSEEEGTRTRWRTGETLAYLAPSAREAGALSSAVFRTPSGREVAATLEGDARVTLASAEEIGVHDLRVAGTSVAQFPVGLLSAAESRLTPAERVDLGDFTVDVASEAEKGARDLWKWLALAALGFVLVEWIVYHRRFV